jgi:uncharacterized repeat protein (TIGR02543 family)
MTVKLKTGTSTWSTIKKAWAKTGTSTWSPAKAIFAKLSTGWQQIWPGNTPAVNTADPINIRLTSYSGAIASSPQYINTKLYGNDGSFTGTTPITISGRKMRVASDDTGNGTRYVVESSDIFDMSNSTATDRYYVDGWYLFYELTATNIDGDLNAFSPPIKIIKRVPQFSGVSLTGTVDVGQQLTFNFTAQNFYYNSPDYSRSYVRWWRNTSKTPGGTILQTTYLTDVTRVGTAWGDGYSNTPTSATGYSTYNVQSADTSSGTYVVAELVLINSYHDHYGGTTGTYVSSGGKPIVGSLSFLDNNGRDGTDNQSRYPYYSPRIPVATSISVNASISNAAANTAYVIKYRIYNNETGVYWKPFDEVTATSGSAAWQSYTPSSSFSGETATITDYFNISSTTFNGSTYNDGINSGVPRWQLEIQIIATTPGFSASYNNPPFNFEVFALSPGVVPTISASPSSGGIPLAVTFTGSFTGFPLGSSYPRAYRINYGDGNYSGWQTFSTNSANPSYSNSYTYTTIGSYSPLIEVQPATTSASTSVTAISVPNAPTTLTATTTRSDGVLLSWNAVSGANYYEIYWGSILGGGPINQSSFADFGQDNSITTNSFLDTTISAGSTRYYRVRARSNATAVGANCSNWYPGPTLDGIVGTRVTVTPSVPTGLSGSGNGRAANQTITLTWSAATNASKYELYYNGTGTTPLDSYAADYPNDGSNLTATTFTTPYQSFAASTTYYWWVRSVSSTGTKSTWSSRATVVTNREQFTVTWAPNSGTVSPTTSLTDIDGYVTAPTPTRSGYTFNGWYNTVTGDWLYGPIAAGSSWLVPSTITMNARWSVAVAAPTNSTAPTLTPTSIAVGTILTAGRGTWTGSPTSYDVRIYRGTQFVSTGETLKASGTGTSVTYTVTQADYDSGQLYFRTYVDATNSGGSSGLVAGQERGPIAAPVVAPTNSTVPTTSGNLTVGSVITFGVGTWNNTPTSYDLRLYRGTQFVSSGETLSKSAGNVTSSTYTITQADYDSGQRYFRAYASATNAGGTSSLTAGQEIGPITVASTPAPVLSSISGNNSLTLGGTFSWSYTNSPTGYSILCQGPTGTVYTTSNAYSYSGTTFRPGYDGTGWQGAGNYTIYVSATNSGGSSVVSSQTTYMS